jgi:hypothetical protein
VLASRPEQLADIGIDADLPYKEAAEAAPAAFLASLRDIVLAMIERMPKQWGKEHRPRWDGYHWNGGSTGYREGGALFNAMSLALGRLAEIDEALFRSHLGVLAESDWLTAHIIVAQALSSAPATVASRAAHYLHDIFSRYVIGEDEYFLWPIRDAIVAMSPHWSGGEIGAIARHILSVRPIWERSVDGFRSRGRVQRSLLEALPEDQLPHDAHRQLLEWRRKVGTESGQRPGRIRGGRVTSPLSAETTALTGR